MLDKTKKPILVYYYTPGEAFNRKFRKFLLEFDQSNPGLVNYIFVNCRSHLEDCRNETIINFPFLNLRLPKTLVKEGNEEKEIYPSILYQRDLSNEGLENFLRDYGIMEQEKHDKQLMNFVRSKIFL
jgi:hypothetical protein